MEKDAKINALLNQRFDRSPLIVWPAIVKSVEGLTCTVTFLTNDLEVDEVRLRADVDATEGVLITPRVDSLVLVATLENSLDNLFVCLVSEVDSLDAVIDKVTVSMSKEGVTVANDTLSLSLANSTAMLKQDQTQVVLANGKVTVKNSGTNLKDLFSAITDLLKNFSVITPVMGAPTPSATVSPASLASITQLTVKVNQLLA